jgi:hypothetical protein
VNISLATAREIRKGKLIELPLAAGCYPQTFPTARRTHPACRPDVHHEGTQRYRRDVGYIQITPRLWSEVAVLR